MDEWVALTSLLIGIGFIAATIPILDRTSLWLTAALMGWFTTGLPQRQALADAEAAAARHAENQADIHAKTGATATTARRDDSRHRATTHPQTGRAA